MNYIGDMGYTILRPFFDISSRVLGTGVATIGDDAEETQTSFDVAGTRYEFRKVGTQGEHGEPPKQVIEDLPGLSPLPR